MIHTSSKLTSEVWLLDAATPTGEFSVVAPRRQGVEYDVEVAGDRLLILHNDGAENFELASAPLPGAGDTSAWTPVIAHRADTRLLSVDAFESYLVLYYRRDGLTGLSVLPPSGAGEERPITFPEPLYTVGPGANPEYTQTRFRLGYNSMVTPSTVYDYDLATGDADPAQAAAGAAVAVRGRVRLRRLRAVPRVGGRRRTAPGCRSRSSAARARRATGPRPACSTGTAATSISIDPSFSITRLSLLDRGFVFAIAHVRGGGEMGRPWYDHGKMLEKRNTFTDFVACAEHLVVGRLDVRRPGWSPGAGRPAGC